MNRMITALAAAAIATLGGATAAGAAPRGTAEIPFVNFGGIRSWTANDEDTLYVQSAQNKWYEVDLATPCYGLPFALRVGVDTGAIDTLDSFSNIIVDGQRCPVAGVTQVDAPPARRTAKSKA